MARPGKINHLEYPHFLGEPPFHEVEAIPASAPANLYALGALLTLLDREVTFTVAMNGQWLPPAAPIVQWLILRSGAITGAAEHAMFAFFCDHRSTDLILQLNRGTLVKPESSATVFYCVEQLMHSSDQLEETASWIALELRGPGIKEACSVFVAELEKCDIEQISRARQGYPLGIDMYLTDTAGRCIGLPRTTLVRIVNQDKTSKEG
jgi:alpha-D-ribose 1-methylphosphonate 5-triphosphate synthase subunit PhnH